MALRIDPDHRRFRDIVRGKIKQDLRKYISQGELIGRKGKDLVSIPLPQINVPRFRFGSKDRGGVGQGDGEVGDSLGQMADRHGVNACERRFLGRLRRAEESLHAEPPSPLGDRENASDSTQPAVESKLPDRSGSRKRSTRHLERRAENRKRDRQVETGALLPQLRRREVDGYPAVRELQLGCRDPAADALTRLLARAIGEADDGEARQPVPDVRLDVDAARLEADESVRERASEHTSTLELDPLQECRALVPAQ